MSSMRGLGFLSILAASGLLVASGARAAVTVTVTSGNLSASATGTIEDGTGTPTASDSRALGPADFPGGTGRLVEVGASAGQARGGNQNSSGGNALSRARVLSAVQADGSTSLAVEFGGSADASCTTTRVPGVQEEVASASAATSGALTIAVQLDEPMDVEVTGRLSASSAVTVGTPPPPPTATASFSFGPAGGSVSASGPPGDEIELNQTARIPAGVTVLQVQQSVSGASFSGCLQSKFGSTVVSLVLTFRPAADGEIAWINPLGGAWGTAANWDPARVPTAADRAHFALASSYTVGLGGARTLQSARVRTSLLDLAGGALALTGRPDGLPSLAVGEGARLTLQNATLQPTDVAIGDVPLAAASTLRVPAGGALGASGALRVGDRAAGVLECTGGTVAAGSTTVGGPAGVGPLLNAGPATASGVTNAAPGTVGGLIRVAGGGGTFADLTVGAGGPGLVDVLGGGVLRVLGASVVGATPGPGLAVVNGVAGSDAFSSWQNGGELIVGRNAEGTFDVLAGGRVTAPSVVLGAEPGGDGTFTVADFANPQTRENPSSLTVDGRIGVGGPGLGRLAIRQGAVRAGEVRIAELDDRSTGTVRVEDGSLVVAGLLAVGVPGEGQLVVTGLSAYVEAENLTVAAFTPARTASAPSFVDVGDGSDVVVENGVVVGGLDEETGTAGGFGSLRVQSGGRLQVSSDGFVRLDNGELVVQGQRDGMASRLSSGKVELFNGELRVRDGGRLDAGTISVSAGFDTLHVPPALVVENTQVAAGTLEVGVPDDPVFRGFLRLDGTARVEVTDRLFVGPGGVISGSGAIRVGSVNIDPAGGTLTNLGVISAGNSPGTIAVDGNLFQGPTGRLVVELAGTQPGAFDVVAVTGEAALGGTLVLRLLDGYLPQPGDAVAFLTSAATRGAFAAVRVEGVAPGFDFTVAPGAGGLVFTARSAAQPPPCLDPGDADGDGVACGDTCPVVANPAQTDADLDGAGDACDPCLAGVPLGKPVLALRGKQLVLKATLPLPAGTPLEPVASGARLLVEDAAGRAVATLAAPPGAFARGTKSGWKKNRFVGRGALKSLRLDRAKKTPDVVTVAARAVVPRVRAADLAQPLVARVLLRADDAPTSHCGEAQFAGPRGVNPECSAARVRLVCRARTRR